MACAANKGREINFGHSARLCCISSRNYFLVLDFNKNKFLFSVYYLFTLKYRVHAAFLEKKQALPANTRNPYLCQPLKKIKTSI